MRDERVEYFLSDWLSLSLGLILEVDKLRVMNKMDSLQEGDTVSPEKGEGMIEGPAYKKKGGEEESGEDSRRERGRRSPSDAEFEMMEYPGGNVKQAAENARIQLKIKTLS